MTNGLEQLDDSDEKDIEELVSQFGADKRAEITQLYREIKRDIVNSSKIRDYLATMINREIIHRCTQKYKKSNLNSSSA